MNHKILIIDYGLGNHQSVASALDFLGYSYIVSNKKNDFESSDFLILPGVGAFYAGMENLKKLDIIELMENEVIKKKKPILGICLGMQLFAIDSTEDGIHQGLGWIKGHVLKIKGGNSHKIPHVGWNNLKIYKKEPLFNKELNSANFYFDHSYHILCDKNILSASVDYGEEITAAIQYENIFGVQFHPEKSQNNGLKLFRSILG
ncbi:imidazole glycerol phosphate synthase, glutamine amidotransferase subunit [Candidatus Omnitrophus magneticus]|uniref:Imidazole glycerol phosphate synthase subunit HisH n=1 Tax=Candidatus Omnitrophus magneticus TaxID=1609969 RepID=A0A0F0CQC8_9BACT|nr:imidazole glycerol phosphate synthase, glutamine amidotransferase subunit [Candidatus Omnitrophus magneticus]